MSDRKTFRDSIPRILAFSLLLLAVAVTGQPSGAASSRPFDAPPVQATASPDALLELADRARARPATGVVHVKVTLSKHGKADGDAEFDLYHQGESRALAVFTAGRQKGRRVLTVDEKVWLLVPGVARPVPISANQRLIGGVSLDDVARLRFSRAFTATLADAVEEIDGLPCDVLALQAKHPGGTYGSGTLWVDRASHLPRQALLNLASGKPAREVRYLSYEQDGSNTVLSSLRIVDLLSRGSGETRLEFSNRRRVELPEALFTPEGALKFEGTLPPTSPDAR